MRARCAAIVPLCGMLLCVGNASALGRPIQSPATYIGCRIVGYAVSPDGHHIAVTTSCGGLRPHSESIVIESLDAVKKSARVVFSANEISGVRWIGVGAIAFVRGGPEFSVMIVNSTTGKCRTVARFRHAVSINGWFARRKMMIVSRGRAWRWDGRVSVRLRDSMSTLGLIAPRWARPTTERVTLLRLKGGSTGGSVRTEPMMSRFAVLPQFAWTHGKLIGLVQSGASYRSRIFDITTGGRVDRGVPLFNMGLMAVSGDGHIAVTSTHIWRHRPKPTAGWGGSQRVFVVTRGGAVRLVSAFSRGEYLVDVSGLWWVGDDNLIAQVMGSSAAGGPLHWWLEEVNWRRDRVVRRMGWPGGDLGGITHRCAFDQKRTIGVCVAQTLTTPPQLVEVNMTTGAIQAIAQVNPTQKRLMVSFRDVPIRNRFGNVSTAYLAVPKVAASRAVPLAVLAYGFTRAYSKNAQWITSYPVARLVHSGIAVCMVNWAHVSGSRADGFSDELRAMQGDVSTLEEAVPAVKEAGINVSRAMIFGWSFGGLFAAHAIESDPTFVAAQVGDPAEWDVAGYALGNGQWRVMSKWGMGGPPVGINAANYLALDPVGAGAPPLGPVLLEFVSRHPAVGQLIQEWRGVGANLEVFAYRRSVHWLNVPAEARISRTRNLYWAKLNLLGPGSVTEAELRRVGLTVPANGWWDEKRHGQSLPGSKRSCRCQSKSGSRLQRRGSRVAGRKSDHKWGGPW